MGKGKRRAVEKGVLGNSQSGTHLQCLNIPQAPVYYPSEFEFSNPLKYIEKIKPEVEAYGICRIVPPESWKPPFAINLDSFRFPTKLQAIHQLQARAASCDPKTFELEYNRFLESHSGRKLKKRPLFEGQELDLCKLFNAVKRFGGYENVVREKKWGDVFRFISFAKKISECSKHVLSQLYREHLYDYEEYLNKLNRENQSKHCKVGYCDTKSVESGSAAVIHCRKRRKNLQGEKVEAVHSMQEELDQICEQCKSGLHGEVMLLCDRCNRGWHLYCLSPPLESVPLGNWYCLECVNSNKDTFGFVPGKRFSLEAFKRLADRGKKKWFGTTCPTRSQVEKRFWEIVEGSVGEVEALYGNDLDTSIYGSGFPRMGDPLPDSVEPEVWDKYSSSPWNLNNLPKLEDSMLKVVHDNITGVIVPWLYIGMLFSSFCWHFEDHCFYSMNYLHWGEPKCWYSVPGSEALAFEQVMRKTLPDLFDSQPDLLFQLVTMLNPSVLQQNGVPVYSVIQEPGNFVITFPRSFHGGFNFGLNCAEAVNFAPADWLPHGSYGADLYRLYHKPAVLSHEELICVVAKNTCNDKMLPYMKEEMIKIFSREKESREELWKHGIVKSSQMPPHKHPEYMGIEEDPKCIICLQYLYLSAVVCSCRPSSFVCLEHWKHLCECNLKKHRLLYRHTLADLYDLLLTVTERDIAQDSVDQSEKQLSCFTKTCTLTKKVKGQVVVFSQIAEAWLSRSHKLFQCSFSDAVYAKSLNECEQFLWAGHEMDEIRSIHSSLTEARKWAVSVRSCLSKIETWLSNPGSNMKKVSFNDVESLVRDDFTPCVEPGYPKLKLYGEEARLMLSQIKSALLNKAPISELEALHAKAACLPIQFDEGKELSRKISVGKAWLEETRRCLSQKKPASIEVYDLYKLKSEMLDLNFKFPEMEHLSDLLIQVESWRSKVCDMLKLRIWLKDLENLLQEATNFTVNIPEFKILQEIRSEALSWIFRVHEILDKIRERDDYGVIVQELNCLLNEGASLRIQVEELALVEAELKKSCCRQKAHKVCSSRMPLDYVQELMAEAACLRMEKEQIFFGISGTLANARSWEDRAQYVLINNCDICDFEDLIRTAESIHINLPSYQCAKDALDMAKSWRRASQPFLSPSASSELASGLLLKIDDLKELISQSKLLKVSMNEPALLQKILENVEVWECDACNILEHVDSILDVDGMDSENGNKLIEEVEELISSITAIQSVGLSLRFELPKMHKLENAILTLRWSARVLSHCACSASLEEVEILVKEFDNLPTTYAHKVLVCLLVEGNRWFGKALRIISCPKSDRRFSLMDVEAVLEAAQNIKVPCGFMRSQLTDVIEKHKSWVNQVIAFYDTEGQRYWLDLVNLKESAKFNALESPELEKVMLSTAKVDKWLMHCREVVGLLTDEIGSLTAAFKKIKGSLDRALCMYRKSETEISADCCCICSPSDNTNDLLTCLRCTDKYHLSCLRSLSSNASAVEDYICPFCLFMEGAATYDNGGCSLILRRRRPRLSMFVELLQDSRDFCLGIEERDLIEVIVEQALMCKSYLSDTVALVLNCTANDLSSISADLRIAFKAVAIAVIYDHEDTCNLELALTRNMWKVRVERVLNGSVKPNFQLVQQLLKMGLEINVPSGDGYMKGLVEVKQISLKWASLAKKVTSDSGELRLVEVLELIKEGENLPIHFEKLLKLLRTRSELYCICRKPYDQRAMIACDHCDEWYHFDCINLVDPPPKNFTCSACKPLLSSHLNGSTHVPFDDDRCNIDNGPVTPPPRQAKPKRRQQPAKARASLQHKMKIATDLVSILRYSSETDHLWRKSQKPFRRTAKKRCQFDSISLIFHLQS